jgi:hypothetical protein
VQGEPGTSPAGLGGASTIAVDETDGRGVCGRLPNQARSSPLSGEAAGLAISARLRPQLTFAVT